MTESSQMEDSPGSSFESFERFYQNHIAPQVLDGDAGFNPDGTKKSLEQRFPNKLYNKLSQVVQHAKEVDEWERKFGPPEDFHGLQAQRLLHPSQRVKREKDRRLSPEVNRDLDHLEESTIKPNTDPEILERAKNGARILLTQAKGGEEGQTPYYQTEEARFNAIDVFEAMGHGYTMANILEGIDPKLVDWDNPASTKPM